MDKKHLVIVAVPTIIVCAYWLSSSKSKNEDVVTEMPRPKIETVTADNRLYFVAKPKAECFIGDLDILSNYLSSTKGRGSLVASLIPLNKGSNQKPQTMTIPRSFTDTKRKPLRLRFEFPRVKGKQAFALTICSGSKSCLAQKPINMEKQAEAIGNWRFNARGKPVSTPAGLFFFKYLLVEDTEMYVIEADSPEVEALAIPNLLPDNIDRKTIDALLKTTTSTPLNVNKRGNAHFLAMTLPFFSEAVCKKELSDEMKRKVEQARRGQSPRINFEK